MAEGSKLNNLCWGIYKLLFCYYVDIVGFMCASST
jgi:hypothetical protein